MKRDLDLIREIFLASEEIPYEEINIYDLEKKTGRELYDLIAHIHILEDNQMVKVINVDRKADNIVYFMIYRVTFKGFDFIDKIREETRFKEVKSAADKVKDWSFDTLKEITKQIVAQAITGSI